MESKVRRGLQPPLAQAEPTLWETLWTWSEAAELMFAFLAELKPQSQVLTEGEETEGEENYNGAEDVIADEEEQTYLEEPIETQEEPTNEVYNQQLFLSDSITYPVYTNINTRGAVLEKSRGQKVGIIKKPDPNGIKRDMEIFMVEDIPEDDYNTRTSLENALRQLISGILYDKKFSDLSLGKNSTLTIETYNKLKENLYLVVKEIDKERDVRINPVYGRKGTSEVIDSIKDNKTVAIIAEADNIQVTLGYLGNPSVQLKQTNIKALSNRINRSAMRLKALRDQEVNNKTITQGDEKYEEYNKEINKLLDKASETNLKADAKLYESTVNALIDKGVNKYKIKVTRNGFSNLYRIKGIPPLLTNIRKNPNVRTSKVVIYNGNLPGVSEKLKGRPVVIQTGDTTANVQSLVDSYVDQRQSSTSVNPLTDKSPKCRMMMLNTKGLQLDDLLNTEVTSPIAWQIVGLKSFVSAWNFRADLITLQKQLQDFLRNNSYNLDTINQVLTIMDDEYRNQTPRFEKPSNYEEIKQKLIEFNKSLGNKVRQFRLGGRVETQNSQLIGSQYIRKLELESSNPFYKNPNKAYGIYIHPERIDLFLNILNSYFKVLEPLVNPQFNGESLDPTKIISGKDKASNNINGYITEMQRKNIYTINGIQLDSTENSDTKFAAFLIGTLRIINQAIGIGTPGTSLRETQNRQAYLGVNLQVNGEDLKLETSEIFKNILISPTESDYIIEDLFRLILHGTTEDINDENGRLKPDVVKSTAAYFKAGIWPEAKKGKSINSFFSECTLDEKFFTMDAIAESPVIRVTAESLRNPTILEVQKTEEENKESLEKVEQAKTLSLHLNNENEQDILQQLKTDTYENILKGGIRQNINLIFSAGTAIQGLLNLYIGLDNNKEPITFEQKLVEKAEKINLNTIIDGTTNNNERTFTDGHYDVTIKKNKKTIDIFVREHSLESEGDSLLTNLENRFNQKIESIEDQESKEEVKKIVKRALDQLEASSSSSVEDKKTIISSIITTLNDYSLDDIAVDLISDINDVITNNLNC